MEFGYTSPTAMKRGLAFCHTSGQVQNFGDITLRNFAEKPRADNGILYVACDSMTVRYPDGGTDVFTAGNLFYLPQGCRYSLTFAGTKGGMSDIQVQFKLRNPFSGKPYIFSDRAMLLLKETPASVYEDLLQIADATLNILYPTFPIARAFYEMMDVVSRRMRLPEMTGENANKVMPALYYMEKHITDNTPVSDLARLCAMCESSFRRHFRAVTGMSPIAYRQSLRLRKLKSLVRYSPDVSSRELVEKLGFCDVSYLYKAFEREAGMSLAQYRASCKED